MSEMWLAGISLGLLLLGLLAYARVNQLLPWQKAQEGSGGIQAVSHSASKGWFWFGYFLVILLSGWTVIRIHPEYHDFFVIGAYLPLDCAFLAASCATIGTLVHAVRLHRKAEHAERADLAESSRLAMLLPDLQQACAVRLPSAELSRIFLQILIDRCDTDGGAVMLATRGSGAVIAAQQGFLREDISAWEENPDGLRLIRTVSNGVDILRTQTLPGKPEEPVQFELIPLRSGLEGLGCVILKIHSATANEPSRQRMLLAASAWLADRLQANQRERDAATLRQTTDGLSNQLRTQQTLVHKMLLSFASSDLFASLTESLRGLFGASEVFFVRRSGGRIMFLSGGEHVLYSDAMTEALVDALQRTTPLVINQEFEEASEYSLEATKLLWSNLVVPVGHEPEAVAVVFRSANGRMMISDQDQATLSIVVEAVRLSLQVSQSRELEQLRRRMLDRVIRLLRDPESLRPFAEDPGWFFRRLAPALPVQSRWLVWVGDDNAWVPAVVSHGVTPANFELRRQSASAVHVAEPMFYLSASQTSRALTQLGAEKESVDAWLESANAQFHVLVPFDNGLGLLSIPLSQLSSASEYERMLLLASHLTRLLYRSVGTIDSTASLMKVNETAASAVESAAIKGQKSIPASDESIMSKDSAPATALHPLPNVENEEDSVTDIDSDENLLTPLLERNRISGNLYMIGGRPREVLLDAQGSLPGGSVDRFAPWLEQVLARFSMATAPDDHLVVELRSDKSGHLLLLHRVNRLRPAPLARPPHDRLRDPRTVPLSSATDAYRRMAMTAGALLWIDQSAASPTAIGFYFPTQPEIGGEGAKPLEIIAVDSSPIILDLIVAMGQSQEMTVHRHSSIGAARLGFADVAVDLAFIDLSLPDGSGLDFASELHLKRPTLPIILVCGWERTLSPKELQQAGINRVLRKPFRLEQLSEMVHDLIGKRPAERP